MPGNKVHDFLFAQTKARDTVLAVIPARGGSKGIPRRMSWIFAEDRSSPIPSPLPAPPGWWDRVLVSTDDEEIADVARSLGAEVPFLRPSHLAGDKALVSKALNHLVESLYPNPISRSGVVLATLYPTSPFRTPELLDSLISKVLDGLDFVVTGQEVRLTPTSVVGREADGRLTPYLHQANFWGGAEEMAFYRPYGLASVARCTRHSRFALHRLTDQFSTIDIDMECDLRLARWVIENGLFDFQVETLR